MDNDLLKLELFDGMIAEYKPPASLLLTSRNILPVVEDVGQTVAWDIEKAELDVQGFETLGGSAGVRKTNVIGHRTATLARTFKSKRLPGAALIDLRAPGSMNREAIAEAKVARETRTMLEFFARQNEYMRARALQGSIALAFEGGLVSTVDYGFLGGDHDITPAPRWSDTGADIETDIALAVKAIAQDSGRDAVYALCGSDVIAAIMKNDRVTEYFAKTAAGTAYMQTRSMGQFQGLEWLVDDQVYKPAGGSNTPYVNPKDVIIFPAPDSEWGEFRVGSDVIPSDDRLSVIEKVGQYVYPNISINPASIELFAGIVRLPIIRNVGAIAVIHALP